MFKHLKLAVRRWLPRIYWGNCPDYRDHSALVLFPFHPNLICCGLVGVVEFRKKSPPLAAAGVVNRIRELLYELRDQNDQADEIKFSPQGIQKRNETVHGLEQLSQQCRRSAVFYDLFLHKSIREDLSQYSRDLKTLIEDEEREREKKGTRIPSGLLEVYNKELVILKDVVWSIQNECLANIRKVKEMTGKNKAFAFQPQVVQEFRKINFILNNLDRLEVRGRDSAGISVMVTFPDQPSFQKFLNKLEKKDLCEQLKERQGICDLLNRHISCSGQTMTFTFKVAAEIGKLGDNIQALRQVISQDIIFPLAVQEEHVFTTTIAHTRWASVGMISEENCHPVNNEYHIADGIHQSQSDLSLPSIGPVHREKCGGGMPVGFGRDAPYYQRPIGPLQVVLNGDIDNYAELKETRERESGKKVSERITTDTKIIPLQVEYYLRQGHSLVEAFRRAVNDFEGSQAIALQSDLEPGRIFLSLRGSGQSIFVGIGEEGYFPASEIYGFVEETSRFIKMEGERERAAGEAGTQGQIFVLDADSKGGMSGITAMGYDGQPLLLSDENIQSTEITTRDIDRRGFPHYFLKEISESPQSVKKTILGRVDLTSEGDPLESKRVIFNMGEEIIPARLEEALQSRRIKNIYMVGQGTAGIAAEGIAMLFQEYLAQSGIQIAEQKASELSGFRLDGNRSDTLVIAVTQSGTTTDTNKAVDMARNAGACTLAIVNRRNSDITYKADGVFYTSDGRDIEMSVASTKAFYSQIVAGCLLGLRFAQIMGLRSEEYLIQEIKQLKRLPRLMAQILQKNQEEIAASARKWALLKRNWAVVGSGPNKVAADEIRIKLSELCYKTLPSDVVEDRKHIDLSAEPLVLVCAAGSREIVLGDIIKDVAIFKAHKATTIVITHEGEYRFGPCADSLIQIPRVGEQLSPVLNTLVGHLWGYYAALYTDEEANFLKSSRQLINQKICELEEMGYNSLEIVFDRNFQNLVNEFAFALHQKNSQGILNASVKSNTMSDLILLLKYAGGKLPITDLERDFQVERGISNCLQLLRKALDQAVNELSRPIDAIKHQAKTVTVGTSRLPEMLTGYVFEFMNKVGIPLENITTLNLSILKRLQPVIRAITGYTLYEINQLDSLGRAGEDSTIRIVNRDGISKNLHSRVEKDPRLRGRKRSIITSNSTFIGLGKSDNARLLIIPAQGKDIHQKMLILFHIDFEDEIPLKTRMNALGAKYDDLVDALAELDISWQDEFLDSFSTAELFIHSEDDLVEAILSRLRESDKKRITA
ncbi:MAG: SIS domain-containing protein [bacterium]